MDGHARRCWKVLAFFALTLIGGCSRFDKQWDLVAGVPVSDPIAGCWEGDWVSERNQHRGTLRCIATRVSDDTYLAWFDATYWTFCSGDYVALLKVTPAGDAWQFTAESDLGALAGGVYRQTGQVKDGTYTATYDADHNFGRIEMTRP